MTLRVLGWNFLEGGHVPRTRQMDVNRVRAAQAVVRDTAPDAIVINEALWCELHSGRLVDYAAMLGVADWHVHGRLYDKQWGNVILSRFPILTRSHFSIYNRGGLVATIGVPGGPIQLGTYHPHPHRRPESKAQDFLDLVAAADSGLPLALLGDFNAVSPEDPADPERLARGFAAFSAHPEADSRRFLDSGRAIFSALAQAGFRDAVAVEQRQPTMPTPLAGTTDGDSAMRIDHAWICSKLQAVRATVVRTQNAEQASDHFPLLVELASADENKALAL